MTSWPFPRASRAVVTGEPGIAIVTQRFLRDLGWLVRRTHLENDFGIDAHVDLVEPSGDVTGRQFAIQVKCGDSYFRDATEAAIPCHGELRHLNYCLNYPLPVLILLVEPASGRIFWARLALEQTRRTSGGWSMDIPKSHELTTKSAQELSAIAGPAVDHTEALEVYWKQNEFLGQFERVLVGVSRDEVEAGNVEAFAQMFERLQMNDGLARRLEGRVGFFILGYDSDPRELWEVSEVRRWVVAAQSVVKYWFYFWDRHAGRRSLIALLALCVVHPVRREDGGWEFEAADLSDWLNQHFASLNEITARLCLGEQENQRISLEAFRCIFPDYEPEE